MAFITSRTINDELEALWDRYIDLLDVPVDQEDYLVKLRGLEDGLRKLFNMPVLDKLTPKNRWRFIVLQYRISFVKDDEKWKEKIAKLAKLKKVNY